MLNRRSVVLALAALPVSALADEQAAQRAMREVIGDRHVSEGGVEITAPRLAENGAQVPVAVHVPSPMTEADHVRAIHLFATSNPTPGVASFRFHSGIARAEVRTRIRLAEAQRVLVLAELSDGRVLGSAVEIDITTGGCIA